MCLPREAARTTAYWHVVQVVVSLLSAWPQAQDRDIEIMASTPSIGFIGGGMMASALIGGFLKSGAVKSPSGISVSEPYPPLREKHAKNGHFATENNVSVAERSDVIWLATKPDVIPVVLSECGTALL